jgi:DNA primase
MLDKDQINAIKERINIVDIVSEHLSLKKAGRSYFALCPFHQENTPSFSINEDFQFFHCFGCQESGDVITFVEKIENVDFNEAIEILAKRAGIKIEKKYNKDEVRKSNRIDILKINTLVINFFQSELLKNKQAISYLQKRSINKESVKTFKIGYNPRGDNLTRFLKSKGISKELSIKYGFTKDPDPKDNDNKGLLHDKFQNRIIFPISNIKGNIIGFTSRAIDDTTIPKYLNSPETDVFKKSDVLYGIDIAKNHISKQDSVIITEGNIDVIQSNQNGILNIVGIQGTAITENHLNMLKRFTNNIYFAFDSDKAGYAALRKSSVLAENRNFNTMVIDLREAKDIDEYILKYGNERWKLAVNEAKDYLSFIMDYEINNNNIQSYRGKIAVVENISEVLNSIPNAIKKSFFVSELAKRLDLSFDIVDQYIKKNIIKKPTDDISQELNKTRINKNIEIYFLYIIINYPELRGLAISNIQPEYLNDPYSKKIYEHLILNDFKKDIDTIDMSIQRSVSQEYIMNDDIKKIESDISNIVKIIKNRYIKDTIKDLKSQLKNDPKENQRILKKIGRLSSEYIQ